MKAQYRAVVIGGGVVGASVLFHLARLGWTDVALIERAELTAGSTWHAAAGFHAINADPNIAALQGYTIRLYQELQAAGDHDLGLHMTGGINMAGTPERWEWLQATWALFKTMGMESELIGPDEIRRLCPIVDVSGVYGGLYDRNEGHLDAYGTTQAYAKGARRRGADVILHNRVLELHPRPDGAWTVVTEQGTLVAEHVVNAGGLWAKQVGLMAGVDLPVTPMQHHYLVTEDIPEVKALDRELPLTVDMEGFTYLRQERHGLLLGIYERRPKHWQVEGAPWDYGTELIPEEIERIAPELEIGFSRFPCLQRAGIKRWVNGAFTFTPDGNPLVGPVPGLRNYWVACGVMAGFSQGGGVGLSLAQWMIEGEPGTDIFGMDVARYGAFAANRAYLKAKTAEFYARRFVLTYPNEELPAGRPLRTSPAHDALQAQGARFGAVYGLEIPRYFAPGGDAFVETPTLRRSNAFPIVAAECSAVRNGVGVIDTTAFARYEVAGPGARPWLDRLLACRLPKPGRARLAPMLSRSGRLMGDLTVFCWRDDLFWLMGSYYLQEWHLRWFGARMPDAGVALRNLSDAVTGFALSGPRARDVLQAVTEADVSGAALPFMGCAEIDVGLSRARVGRLSVCGELGFEINVAAAEQRTLHRTLLDAGAAFGLRQIGYTAMNVLRIEKAFGIWSREFTWAYTAGMSGLDRFVAFDKPDFVGRDAALRERDAGTAKQVLVPLVVDADDADASGFEPVWIGERRVGFVTSGAYGHTVGASLALAYLDRDVALPGTAVDVHVVGVKRTARVGSGPFHDPDGSRLRA
ncbi:MAG: FAD-dependent oxidoreductase [Rhodospirillales bacterium]|nr:FAD-dependent oxidoreductase [Rhodospirillales bacterium]